LEINVLSRRITNAVDVVVTLAALCQNGPVSIAEISSRLKLSTSYLEDIFSRLKKSSLVFAFKGPGGGYVINGSLDELSVIDVVNAFRAELHEDLAATLDLAQQTEKQPQFLSEMQVIFHDFLQSYSLAKAVQLLKDTPGFQVIEKPMQKTKMDNRFKFKPLTPPSRPKAPNSIFQLYQFQS